ncbi:MAG TPA: response regulator transcription factor [Limnochordales bacterium]|nr:response regulator transcription factor [Limnochordales bacterium]
MVTVGLIVPRSLPRFPLLAAVRQDQRFRIVFEAHDLRQLPLLARRHPRPHVLLVDMDMGTGVRALMTTLRSRFPGVPVVLMDRAADAARAQRARNLGAAAVLSRRSRPERFVARVLEVAEGAAGVDRPLRPQLYERLTPREWDILPYLARRYSAREIAAELTLSYATVRTHIRNIYAKCGVGSRQQAARVAAYLLEESAARRNKTDKTEREVVEDGESRRRDGGSDSQSQRL